MLFYWDYSVLWNIAEAYLNQKAGPVKIGEIHGQASPLCDQIRRLTLTSETRSLIPKMTGPPENTWWSSHQYSLSAACRTFGSCVCHVLHNDVTRGTPRWQDPGHPHLCQCSVRTFVYLEMHFLSSVRAFCTCKRRDWLHMESLSTNVGRASPENQHVLCRGSPANWQVLQPDALVPLSASSPSSWLRSVFSHCFIYAIILAYSFSMVDGERMFI